METVGRRLEFEWQLIKGPCLTRTSLRRQCRVRARSTWSLIVLLKLSQANASVSALDAVRKEYNRSGTQDKYEMICILAQAFNL